MGQRKIRILHFDKKVTDEEHTEAYRILRILERQDPEAELVPESMGYWEPKEKIRDQLLREWAKSITELTGVPVKRIIEKSPIAESPNDTVSKTPEEISWLVCRMQGWKCADCKHEIMIPGRTPRWVGKNAVEAVVCYKHPKNMSGSYDRGDMVVGELDNRRALCPECYKKLMVV